MQTAIVMKSSDERALSSMGGLPRLGIHDSMASLLDPIPIILTSIQVS